MTSFSLVLCLSVHPVFHVPQISSSWQSLALLNQQHLQFAESTDPLKATEGMILGHSSCSGLLCHLTTSLPHPPGSLLFPLSTPLTLLSPCCPSLAPWTKGRSLWFPLNIMAGLRQAESGFLVTPHPKSPMPRLQRETSASSLETYPKFERPSFMVLPGAPG